LSNPSNLPEVNHIDGNRKNNCVSNLEWSNRSDNQYHAYRNVARTELAKLQAELDLMRTERDYWKQRAEAFVLTMGENKVPDLSELGATK
jgi:hypothetical protein